MINDCYCIRRLLFTQHLMETVKEGKRGSLMSSFFNRFGEKAEQSQVASAKDALQAPEFSTYISNSGKVICPLVFPGQDDCLIETQES